MDKKQKRQAKTCTNCVHESACRGWTVGATISDAAANQCPNHETVKESAAYLCGVLDERNRKQTRADRIRAMSDEELAKCLLTVDEVGEYCKNLPECEKLLDTPEGIPEEKCLRCLVEWLREPEGE